MTSTMDTARDDTAAAAAEVAALLRAGDPRASAEFRRVFGDALTRFCWGYLGSVEEAEDAVQDIHYRLLDMDEIPDHFRPWLYRTARNHCLNRLRDHKRHHDAHPLPPDSQLRAELTGQLTRMVKQELGAHVTAALRALDPQLREVLLLRYTEGLGRAEIAEVLDIPPWQVKHRLFTGLRELREQVDAMARR
ncbi:MAG: RNA polymerase sigma factor [Phycisphaerae bacterium]